MAALVAPPGLAVDDSAFGDPLDVLNRPMHEAAQESASDWLSKAVKEPSHPQTTELDEERARLTADRDALALANAQLYWENALLKEHESAEQNGTSLWSQWWSPQDPWAAQQAAEAGLCPGITAVLHSLKNASELNGSLGVVQYWHEESGRWVLHLASGEEKFVKPENLVAMPDQSAYFSMYYPGMSEYDAATCEGLTDGAGGYGRQSKKKGSGPGGRCPSGSFASSTTVGSGDDDTDAEEKKEAQPKTTIMMRNVPNNYTRDMLLNLIRRYGFAKSCDLVYLPIDFRTEVGLGYAFINLISPEEVDGFCKTFEGFSDWEVASQKVCEITWSDPLQGLQPHIERYRNSPVMHESVPDSYRPMLFKDGVRVPFPAPTKRSRAPRLRRPGPRQ